MNKDIIHKISKRKLEKIKEENVMFITNPGRMGDEDELTFIIKYNNELTIYKVGELMYSNKISDVSLSDIEKQFPKWFDTWKHSRDKDYIGKYKYLYMGFGNGLSIDNSIYHEFEQYLDVLVNKYLKDSNDEEKESLKYAAVFNVWKEAVINMAYDKGYILK